MTQHSKAEMKAIYSHFTVDFLTAPDAVRLTLLQDLVRTLDTIDAGSMVFELLINFASLIGDLAARTPEGRQGLLDAVMHMRDAVGPLPDGYPA